MPLFLTCWSKKGHVPAQALSMLYGLAQFSAYERCRRILTTNHAAKQRTPSSEHEAVSSNIWLNISCGSFAGGTASLTTFPLDLLRTRLIAQGGPVRFKSLTLTMRQTYTTGGLFSFFHGLSAALISVVPYSAVTFAVYGALRHANLGAEDAQKSDALQLHLLNALQSVLSGLIAGVAGKTCVYPLDVVKKRMQMRGFEQVRDRYGFGASYKGQNKTMLSCLFWTAKNEGVMRGLYKGYAPSCLKAAAAAAASFLFYELAYAAIKKLDAEC